MILENGQTCLEKHGITAREEHLVRSDYSKNNEYTVTHPDAISNGDPQGKGHPTVKGHGHWLPSCDGTPSNKINYSNFATDPSDQIGGKYDIEGRGDIPGRKVQMARSIYSNVQEYGPKLVNTSKNIADGQYYFGQTIGSKTA
jgi:hypothetical protein